MEPSKYDQALRSEKIKLPTRTPFINYLHVPSHDASLKTDYDECTSNPCLNGGTCVNRKRHFTCICPRTHKGRMCEGKFKVK